MKTSGKSEVRDARGNVVPAATAAMLASGDDGDGRRAELCAQIRKRVAEASWQFLGANAAGIVAFAFALKLIEGRVLPRNALQGWPRVAIIVQIFAMMFGIAWIVSTRGQRQVRVHLAVEAGFCGSCAYDLSHLATAGDGCVVCPECGSAWYPRRGDK